MQKTLLIDDLDKSSEAASTVFFGVDGVAYEIDLSEKSYDSLRKTLEPYISVARSMSIPQKPVRGQKSRDAEEHRVRLNAIRVWAKQHGMAAPERGRIPNSVVEAYDAATR